MSSFIRYLIEFFVSAASDSVKSGNFALEKDPKFYS